jgi:alkanesulfonate monooxygenase SsuD/methylene tetrahydromethanopterin reductase-like flavin-dependent oxidoreductase (luciferase family)
MFQRGAAAASDSRATSRYDAAVSRAPDAPSTHRELHLGVTPWVFEGDGLAAGLAEQAAQAEALGFDSLFLPESHFTGPASIPSPLLLLASAAARTARLKLGTTSFLLPVRSPIHVAEEVAVLDQISGGRVILGMGRGFRGALFTAFAVPAEEKRDRFEAAVEVMRRAWAGEPVAWEAGANEADTPTPVRVSPLPVQKPHPPLWVAAFGPKAVAQAARLGLPYLASPIESLAVLEQNYARHRAGLAESGHTDPVAVPVMRTVFVSRDALALARAHAGLTQQAAALAKAPAASLRRAAAASVEDWAIVGEPAEVAERIGCQREKLGITHLIARVQIPGLAREDIEASLHELAVLRL